MPLQKRKHDLNATDRERRSGAKRSVSPVKRRQNKVQRLRTHPKRKTNKPSLTKGTARRIWK